MSSAPLGPVSKPQFVFKVLPSPRQKLEAFLLLETVYVQTHPLRQAQRHGPPEQRPTREAGPASLSGEASSLSLAGTLEDLLFPPRRCGASPTAGVSRHPSRAGGTFSFPEELYTKNTRLRLPTI